MAAPETGHDATAEFLEHLAHLETKFVTPVLGEAIDVPSEVPKALARLNLSRGLYELVIPAFGLQTLALCVWAWMVWARWGLGWLLLAAFVMSQLAAAVPFLASIWLVGKAAMALGMVTRAPDLSQRDLQALADLSGLAPRFPPQVLVAWLVAGGFAGWTLIVTQRWWGLVILGVWLALGFTSSLAMPRTCAASLKPLIELGGTLAPSGSAPFDPTVEEHARNQGQLVYSRERHNSEGRRLRLPLIRFLRLLAFDVELGTLFTLSVIWAIWRFPAINAAVPWLTAMPYPIALTLPVICHLWLFKQLAWSRNWPFRAIYFRRFGAAQDLFYYRVLRPVLGATGSAAVVVKGELQTGRLERLVRLYMDSPISVGMLFPRAPHSNWETHTFANAEWKEGVSRLLLDSDLAVVDVSEWSDAVQHEVALCFAHLPPDRILVVSRTRKTESFDSYCRANGLPTDRVTRFAYSYSVGSPIIKSRLIAHLRRMTKSEGTL